MYTGHVAKDEMDQLHDALFEAQKECQRLEAENGRLITQIEILCEHIKELQAAAHA